MTWDEVVALAKPQTLELQAAGLDISGISEDALEREPLYAAVDAQAGVLIQLNLNKKVIRVQQWKYSGDSVPRFRKL